MESPGSSHPHIGWRNLTKLLKTQRQLDKVTMYASNLFAYLESFCSRDPIIMGVPLSKFVTNFASNLPSSDPQNWIHVVTESLSEYNAYCSIIVGQREALKLAWLCQQYDGRLADIYSLGKTLQIIRHYRAKYFDHPYQSPLTDDLIRNMCDTDPFKRPTLSALGELFERK